MYIECRKMVQMNLLQGRDRDAGIENGHLDTEEKGRVGQIGRLGFAYIHYHV